MVLVKEIFLILLQFIVAEMSAHEKPVTEIEWRGRCIQHAHALNDCNWCRCNQKYQYVCDARICSNVDKFGHFNDAIRDINVGMEGKGSWRSTASACEPAVQYRKGSLLCVCTDDGTWPNPVCRDVFRVLHSVEVTGDSVVKRQTCSPTKLYLIGCNVCFCPSSGLLDTELCTREKCSNDDPVVRGETEKKEKQPEDQPQEIYAECDHNQKYRLGCKTCTCLRNNRLHCENCTTDEDKRANTFCDEKKPGETFSRDCNLCYCDKKGFAYCTTKKCLPEGKSFFSGNLKNTGIVSEQPFTEENCIPGHTYKAGCNNCFCTVQNKNKVFGCSLSNCAKTSSPEALVHMDCVEGTFYELNCLLCQCDEVNGVRTQLCRVNPKCTSKEATRESRSYDLDSMHGYCEPFHVYKKDCNTCHCLADGKTVRCTSYICQTSAAPISVDIVPVAQNGSPCPKGLSYKIDCNFCFCLSNGNAVCTTADCRQIRQKVVYN